jgi:hypothetical protein
VSDTTASEKRQHKRIKGNCRVEFYTNGKMCEGVSGDFSINGLLISTHEPPALKSIVSITVHLPDGSTSKIKGRVRRVHKKAGSAEVSGKTLKGAMGIEIIERDTNYIKFFMSLLSSTKS